MVRKGNDLAAFIFLTKYLLLVCRVQGGIFWRLLSSKFKIENSEKHMFKSKNVLIWKLIRNGNTAVISWTRCQHI